MMYVVYMFAALIMAWPSHSNALAAKPAKGPEACVESLCFQVEVVRTPQDMQRGLQGRTALDAKAGMVFAFTDEGHHPFWMKDTKIPLDIIWIDQGGQVVDIKAHAPPCLKNPCAVYSSSSPAMYVLEVNAGTAEKAGIKPGTPIQFSGIN